MIGNAFSPLTTFNWVNSAAFGAWAVGLALATELIAVRLSGRTGHKREAGGVNGDAPYRRAVATRLAHHEKEG